MGFIYIYLIAVIAFILPLALRKYFIAIQAVSYDHIYTDLDF
jgi:hypothetical protein